MNRRVQPATPLGWWAFWLGFATVVWGRVFLVLPGLLGPLFPGGARSVPVPIGFVGAALELVIAIAALVVGAVALRHGERSWMTLVAFGAAVLVGGFWLVFALGEVLAPH